MKRLLISLLILNLTSSLLGQKPTVLLEIDSKSVEVGETITITVKANIEGEIDIELPNAFVSDYNVMSGMEQEIDYNTGKIISFFYLTKTGSLSKQGTFAFGPAYVKKGNRVYKSNTINVTVRKEKIENKSSIELSAKQLRQPAFGVIEKSKSVIYEGEPLVLNAKVFSRFSPTHLEDYKSYNIAGALDKHEIGNTNQILVEEERIKKTVFYTFKYDKKVLFPLGIGKISIDPFHLILMRGFESLPITASGSSIEIKPLPLPSPKDFIGAVGQFKISKSLKKNQFSQGDVFTLTVEIEGTGNIQNISNPKLKLPNGFVMYGDPIIKEDFVFGDKGAEGKIVYEYNIQLTKPGTFTIPEIGISYFDPKKEKYVTISTEKARISVEKNEQFKSVSDSTFLPDIVLDNGSIGTFRSENESVLGKNSFFGSSGFWMLVSFPFILALTIGLWFRKRESFQSIEVSNQELNTSHEASNELFVQAENALLQGDYSSYFSLLQKAVITSSATMLGKNNVHALSKTEIIEEFRKNGVNQEKITALQELLKCCEEANYGFGISNELRDMLLPKAKEILKEISEK